MPTQNKNYKYKRTASDARRKGERIVPYHTKTGKKVYQLRKVKK